MRSKLQSLENEIVAATDAHEIKTLFIQFVKESTIKHNDKMRLYSQIQFCGTVLQVQTLYYNSVLKFEGLGVIR